MSLSRSLRVPKAELTRTGVSPTKAAVNGALKDLIIEERLAGAMTEGASKDTSLPMQPIPQSEFESERGLLQQQSFSWVGGHRALATAATWVPTKLRQIRLAIRARRFISQTA